MDKKAKDYIKSNTLDLETKNRMDSTGYVQYAVSAAKAYGAITIAEEGIRRKSIEAFRLFIARYGIELGRKDMSSNSEFYVKIFEELITP